MYSDPEEIKAKHKGDIRTLWNIYQSDGKFYKNFFFKVSIILSVLFIVSLCFSMTSAYDIIQKVVEVAFGILPSMLGFNLGAYVLIVGFGGTEILSKITKPLKGQNNYSFYQKLNGVMGVSVLVQISALLSSFFIRIWDKLQDGIIWKPSCTALVFVEKSINVSALFFMTFLVTYSILILVSVIKHVFMFSQTIHFFTYTNRIADDQKKDQSTKTNS
ncbi:hypothetical protein SAMN05421821_102356 [Mucilaginibacter lappiensis]|uniref:Uncharacterized protein n=1 Tax=Mucilaginibacter lappiensis TaxID=354630 RepID=A0ABR6PHB7_9SPHI|nr:hypothetical protein [Mucilaginibacter lappiensis]MBB6108405.1 hypothetical protein [Mucilaginibacter lappiensis]SIQ39059.1 hypothetical protein SAMN05421821_102356 [Mucilaginibacter lappiensis]